MKNLTKKKKTWAIANICAAAIAVVALIAIHSYVIYVNDHECIYKMGEAPDTCSLTVTDSKSWAEDSHGYAYGIQYDFVAKNLTNVNLRDWEATVTVPEDCKIDSFWSGEFEIENGTITITPVVYNKVIEVDGDREFGCILYSNTMDNILDFEIHFYKLISITDLPIFWALIVLIALILITDAIFLVSEYKTKRLLTKKKEYQDIVEDVLTIFSKMIDARDPYTNGHSMRVAVYSRELAKRMGMSEDEQTHVFLVALLHDIGKTALPDSVLKKQGRLTPEEFVQIEQHVRIGGDILKDSHAIEGMADGAAYHHERYDGTGYVKGLKGEEIPLVGRIICVADSFDAMTSDRCYRPALPLAAVIEELKKCSGSQFDPKIVPYMLDMIDAGVAPINLETTNINFYLDKD